METTRVELQNWPHDRGPGGWVVPEGQLMARWVVSRVHARYTAPEVPAGAIDERGRPVRRRFEMRAYLVDLDGEKYGLPDYLNVLVHQVPPVGWWYVKAVDGDYLERIERYRDPD
ncbi:hypothetical protein [Nonomuraea sp. NPDC003804]|uniref:hypothetical protein n=1 Tax=Nonomuraea sp. NPDC003804 TaxID=3154547 RepID=UPI0033BBF56B